MLIFLNIFQDFGSPLIIIPEAGTYCTLFILIDFDLTIFDVKETSSVLPAGTSNH